MCLILSLLAFSISTLSAQALSDIDGNNSTAENNEGSSFLTVASDSLSALDSNLVVERPHVIKRDYDHKEQVIVGSIFMVSIIALLAIMNNFNPRHEQ